MTREEIQDAYYQAYKELGVKLNNIDFALDMVQRHNEELAKIQCPGCRMDWLIKDGWHHSPGDGFVQWECESLAIRAACPK